MQEERREDMRAADSDRAAVAERLRVALDEGRLDLAEYDDRLRRTYAARTYGDLEPLLADLPPVTPTGSAAVARGWGGGASTVDRADRASIRRAWLLENWSGYLGVVTVTVVIWAVTCLVDGDLNYFWPVWVAAPWGAILLVNTLAGLAGGAPEQWAAKKQAKREKAERRRELPRGHGERAADD